MRRSALIIGNYPPPYGGVPRHVEYLVAYLVKRDWDVHVLAGGGGGTVEAKEYTVHRRRHVRKLLAASGYLLRHGKLQTGFMSLAGEPWLLVRTAAFIAHGSVLIRRYGVSLLYSNNITTGGAIGAVLSEQHGIPHVMASYGEFYSNRSFFETHRRLVEFICSNTHKFVSLSKHCAAGYRQRGFEIDPIIINYGVDTNAFSPEIDGYNIRRALDIEQSDPVILFVGRMNKEMGLDTLLEAIPALLNLHNGLRILIIGAQGALYEDAKAACESHSGRVVVLADIPLAELPAYYAASTVVVVPTRGDRACGSLAAVEAMATAKPVIGTAVGGIPEYIENGSTGVLVPPEDPAQLTTAVRAVLTDANMARMMGKNGRERALRYFNVEVTNKRLESLFLETIASD